MMPNILFDFSTLPTLTGVKQHWKAALDHAGPTAVNTAGAWYAEAGDWTFDRLPRIGLLLTATLLALYGRRITDLVRGRIRTWHFVVRTGVFVLLAGFGFGMLAATVAPLISAGLATIDRRFLIPVILGAFLGIGILAERSQRI